MAVQKVLRMGDPRLLQVAEPITAFNTPELDALIQDMFDTMAEYQGAGLAAPQIGLSDRLIVVQYFEREEDEEIEDAPQKIWAVINPEIVKKSEETIMGVEGCLSIPGLVGEVERSTEILVKGLNRYGKPMKVKAKGWLARIFQHEVDHLNGVLFTDLATRVWQPQQEAEQEQEF